MASNIIQGQSKDTEAKRRGISQLLYINMKIFVSKDFGFDPRYFHFDLHSGSGWNDDVNVMGSPLAFLSAAKDSGVKYLGCFIDEDDDLIIELSRRNEVLFDQNSFCFHGDNSELCEMIPDIIRDHGENPAFAMGSIFIDPNGIKNQTPWAHISDVMRACPRLDIIINYPGCGMKRVDREKHEDFVSIHELPKLFAKQHWLIRKPQGAWQWTLCIGRNYRVNDYRAGGFVHWNSSEGSDIRETVYHTATELKDIAMSGQGRLDFGSIQDI